MPACQSRGPLMLPAGITHSEGLFDTLPVIPETCRGTREVTSLQRSVGFSQELAFLSGCRVGSEHSGAFPSRRGTLAVVFRFVVRFMRFDAVVAVSAAGNGFSGHRKRGIGHPFRPAFKIAPS